MKQNNMAIAIAMGSKILSEKGKFIRDKDPILVAQIEHRQQRAVVSAAIMAGINALRTQWVGVDLAKNPDSTIYSIPGERHDS